MAQRRRAAVPLLVPLLVALLPALAAGLEPGLEESAAGAEPSQLLSQRRRRSNRPSAAEWQEEPTAGTEPTPLLSQRRRRSNRPSAAEWSGPSSNLTTELSTSCRGDTGGTCRFFGCHASRGPVKCEGGRCLCEEGSCATGIGTCLKRDQCNRVTGGTCRVLGCDSRRGQTQCISGRCVCEEGLCNTGGICTSGESKKQRVHELGRPPCKQLMSVQDIVEDSRSWCNADKVPEDHRAPAKLQGLYWLKGLETADVAACLSTGYWEPSTRTLMLVVYSDFVWINNLEGISSMAGCYLLGSKYNITFRDDTLTYGEVHSWGAVSDYLFDAVMRLPFIENVDDESSPGEKWLRPTKVIGGIEVDHYEVWKIMDGDMNVLEDNYALMRQEESAQGADDIVRYSEDCEAASLAAHGAVKPAEARSMWSPAGLITAAVAIGSALAVTGALAAGLLQLTRHKRHRGIGSGGPVAVAEPLLQS